MTVNIKNINTCYKPKIILYYFIRGCTDFTSKIHRREVPSESFYFLPILVQLYHTPHYCNSTNPTSDGEK